MENKKRKVTSARDIEICVKVEEKLRRLYKGWVDGGCKEEIPDPLGPYIIDMHNKFVENYAKLDTKNPNSDKNIGAIMVIAHAGAEIMDMEKVAMAVPEEIDLEFVAESRSFARQAIKKVFGKDYKDFTSTIKRDRDELLMHIIEQDIEQKRDESSSRAEFGKKILPDMKKNIKVIENQDRLYELWCELHSTESVPNSLRKFILKLDGNIKERIAKKDKCSRDDTRMIAANAYQMLRYEKAITELFDENYVDEIKLIFEEYKRKLQSKYNMKFVPLIDSIKQMIKEIEST